MDPVLALVESRPNAATAIQAAAQTEAVKINDFIYMSAGTSNSYMVVTDAGRVIINTGMGFESPTHKKVFDAVCPGPTPYLLLTQGHVDHVGGVRTFREGGTKLVAQANLALCQQDDERISDRRESQSYIWFDRIINDALELMDDHPELFDQDKPVADILYDEGYKLSVGGVDFEIIATPGGETLDSAVIWLPQHKILFSGNVFGPLFPHFPNFNTIRGDKYRDVSQYLNAVKTVRDLQPEMLITGHGDPIVGQALIDQCLARMYDAVDYVHTQTLKGINEGKHIQQLMADITLPESLTIGQGYGRVSWCVRTIWENYLGWFKAEKTSELYPTRLDDCFADLVALAGSDAVLEQSRSKLNAGDPEAALVLAEMLLKARPNHKDALWLMIDIHETLLSRKDDADNFWLGGWLRFQINQFKERVDALEDAAEQTGGGFTPQDVFARLPELFVASAAQGVDVTFIFNISGDGGGTWHTRIHNGQLAVGSGECDEPTCTISMASEDFVGLLTGQLNPIKAVMLGRLQVEGDRIQARVLDTCFNKLDAPKRPKAAKKPAGERAPDVVFDDLDAPKLILQQKVAKAVHRHIKPNFTVQAVLDKACKRTGLNDFGPDDFKERLGILLNEYTNDTGLSGLGRNQMFTDMVRYASNRLLIQEQLKKHPEVDQQEIRKPLIVAGLPRSGTTHLVNLLAADQRFASLPLWQMQEPFHIKGKESASKSLAFTANTLARMLGSDVTDNTDPRYLRSSLRWSAMQIMAPEIAAMHPMNPDHIHEELELMAPDFASYNFEWTSVVPNYRDHYLTTDQTPHYAYMKRVMKLLQIERQQQGQAVKPWVLKCPQHMEQLPVLKNTFADATLVVTHRDPVAVIQSAATMMAYPQRMLRNQVNPRQVIDYWTDRVETLLRACVEDRAVWPAEQSMDVLFHEFMAGDMQTVEQVYDLAGIEMTLTARKQMQDFLKAHPRGKHGRVIYNLKDNFGVSAEEIRERFDFYFNAFPVEIEVK